MNQNQIVESLRKESQTDKILNDVMHVFASRKRARETLTVSGLYQRMKKEGFSHDPIAYEKILRYLSTLGIGALETDSKGKVRALKHIKMALQSIGLAAVGSSQRLTLFKQRNKFNALSEIAEVIKPKQPAAGATSGFPVSITVVINGKPVNFRVPKELTEAEIADLVVRFRDRGGMEGQT